MLSKVQSPNFKVKRLFSFALSFLLLEVSSYGQCAMCRASLESSGEITQAEALNDGIVYLMIIPYLLVGLVGWYIFKMYKKNKK